MNDLDLQAAFERAETLYGVLTHWHPQNPASPIDKVINSTDPEENPALRKRLELTKKFLGYYDFYNNTKPSKQWAKQLNTLNTAAKFMVDTSGKVPDKWALLDFVIVPENLAKIFNKSAEQPDLSYQSIYFKASKRALGKGQPVPASAKARHNFTYGSDMASLDAWFKTSESRDLQKGFRRKFFDYVLNYQVDAAQRMLNHLDVFNTPEMNIGLSQERLDAYKENLVYDAESALRKKSGFYPESCYVPDFCEKYMDAEEKFRLHQHQEMEKIFSWQTSLVIGIDALLEFPNSEARFSPDSYKKIRNLLAHEYDNVMELNRAAALMTLVFPEYQDFATYLSKKAIYNPDTQGLDLHKLIDATGFNFQDIDYQAWGSALLDRGPSMGFYLKAAHLLEKISKNDKGVLLIGDIDYQLYSRITDVVDLCTDADIKNYDLKIVKDAEAIKAFREKCRVATQGKKLDDKAKNIPEMILDGADFGRPGYTFARLSYEHPYFPIVGRFTDSCERAGGDWEDPLFNAYIERNAAVYCLFGPDGKPVAHTMVQRHHDDFAIYLVGWEGQSLVTKPLLEKIVGTLREKYHNETFVVGTSSIRLGYEEKQTVNREELEPGSKAQSDPTVVFDVDRLVRAAEVLVYETRSFTAAEEVVPVPDNDDRFENFYGPPPPWPF